MNNDNDKLKKMMAAAESSSDDDKTTSKLKKSFSPKKKKWPWIVGVSTLALFVIGISFAVPKLHDTQKLAKDRTTTVSKTKFTDADAMTKVSTPITLAHWQKKSFSDEAKNNSKELNVNLQSWAQNDLNLSSVTNSGFVSTAAGYTDDTNKAINSDGTINPKYSFLTNENINYIYSSDMNRLLNPVFGDWNLSQFSENKPISNRGVNVLKDMFTDNWWSNNIKENSDYSKLPIYADWAGNDYGMSFKSGTLARWYGELTSENIKMNVNSDGTFKNFDINNNVKYSAFGKDGSIMTKTGVLHLILVQNPKTTDNPTNRLLIDSATLSIN